MRINKNAPKNAKNILHANHEFKITIEEMHVCLTRDNAFIDINGILMPNNLAVKQHRIARNRNCNKIVPCSSFSKYRHSRCKGQGFFFYSQCYNYDNLEPHKMHQNEEK